MITGLMMEHVLLGRWTEKRLDQILVKASAINDPGSRIDFLSKQFLNTSYKESTLIGDISTDEVLVINLEGLDCFTYIDYIEAMRRSRSYLEFRKNLVTVRYKGGETAYKNRNHFFTDWKAFNSNFIIDVTEHIGAGKTKSVSKRLNDKDDGTLFLPGISCRHKAVVAKFKTGDYVGIYSKIQGLDVSHVGIIIRQDDTVSMRHASSVKKHRKVIDEDFKYYIGNKPGFVVLRPRD
jgi:hypothetical protein